jgi:hypothetical protein
MAGNLLLRSAVRSLPSSTTLSLKMTGLSSLSMTSFFSLSTTRIIVSKARVLVLVMAQFGRYSLLWRSHLLILRLRSKSTRLFGQLRIMPWSILRHTLSSIYKTFTKHNYRLPVPNEEDRNSLKANLNQCLHPLLLLPLPEDPFKDTLEYRMLCVGISPAWQKLDGHYSRPTNHLYMLQQSCYILVLSGNGLRRYGEVALVRSAELASNSRSFDLNTLTLQSLLRTQSFLELRTHAG